MIFLEKRVYRKLSAKLQHLIRSNGNLYRIGQHGPDILFYYFISEKSGDTVRSADAWTESKRIL